ncbi:SMP-30/gluconolactonase/LRE family protein [Chelativorans sp. Marseille-P2723]|uniref:SMP-30/gluconolactonase/LRE family protein n=1 Tax=Chelativorans sp. Marseille-P2723 TaxID=2709133 RepID=UPI0015700DCD|nr:SMP-30/gluconolactonase/LRE family protein [Chelativorans sp. Marseille-P2723]
MPLKPDFKIVADGLRFPEGPIAMADGSVVLVEIEARTLSRITPDGTRSVVTELEGGPNGAALGPDGKVYVCNNGGFAWIEDEFGLRPHGAPEGDPVGWIERVDLDTGKVERLYDGNGPIKFRGPNDIVFDRQGGFWFTDAGKVNPRMVHRGGVYYGRTDGSLLVEAIYPMWQANGVGLSPDESRLYVAETVTGRLWEFEVTGPGEVAKKGFPSPHGGRLLAGLPGYQLFDSLAVDSAGNVCVATLMNGGITVVSPDGSSIQHIALPDHYVTNICFGGPELRTAYVTLSQSGKLVSFEWPRPGLPLNFSR